MMGGAESDLGFSYRTLKSGVVEILRDSRAVSRLQGRKAQDFLAEIESCSEVEGQQLMARLTGNYKRGNERLAGNHPRNAR